MPNRSYYLEQSAAMARHRKSYTSMIHNIMVLCGRSDKEAAADAANVMVLETAMARAMKPDDEERDEHGKRITVEDMSKLMPTVDWPLFLRNINLPHVGSRAGGYLVVKNAAYLKAVDGLLKTSDFATIRSYLRWQAVYSFAPYLSFKVEDELVTYNNDLYGISVLPPRWRKCFFPLCSGTVCRHGTHAERERERERERESERERAREREILWTWHTRRERARARAREREILWTWHTRAHTHTHT